MQILFMFGFVSLLLAGHAAAVSPPTCDAGQSASCNCQASTRRRSPLVTRDIGQCSDSSEPCCTETGPGPLQVSPLTSKFDLQCGSKYGDDTQDVTGGVTYSIENCPGSTTDSCLHVKVSPASGYTISDIHLEMDTDYTKLINTKLGTWAFNKYCSTSGDCWVPVSAIPGGPDHCGDTIYAAVGVSINLPGSTSGPTCFNRGSPIGSGNWFMYVKINLECPETCVKGCCCPPVNPPQLCDKGTAYAQLKSDISDYCNGKWGWYSAGVTEGFTAPLILGQTINIGTVKVTIDGGGLHWVYNVNPPYGIIEAHAEVLCSPPVCSPPRPCTPNPCAPGQFNYNSGCLGTTNPQSYPSHWEGDAPVCASGSYWLIFHAKIAGTSTSSDSCDTIACGSNL